MKAVAAILALATLASAFRFYSRRNDNMFMKLQPGEIGVSEAAKDSLRTGYKTGRYRPMIRDSDIVMTRGQYKYLFESNNRTSYKAESDARRRWKDGVVPYIIDHQHFNEEQTSELRVAMNIIKLTTCVVFRPKQEGDKNWIKFTDNGSGCNSQLGMMGWGEQAVNLGEGCKWRGLYLHEIGHALGLIHEHQRPDRDEHVKVIWRRIRTTYLDSFTKYKNEKVIDFGLKYDVSSIMHYEPEAFNDDQELTLVPREPWKLELMYRVFYKTLSFTDTKILNLMYQCGATCENECTGEAYLNKDCECVTPKHIHDHLCQDELPQKQCYERVRAGDCSSGMNAAEMNNKCRRACGSCPTYGMDEFVKPRLTQPYDACVDRYHFPSMCKLWAEAGDCDRFPWWMKRNCRKTCNACDWDQGKCRNYYKGGTDDELCDEYANQGKCTDDYPLIKAGCQGSCKSCGYQRPGDCENDFEHCEDEALAGECDADEEKTAAHRQRYCRKSCNSCFLGRGKCMDKIHPRQCRVAAAFGLCRLEPEKYRVQCPSSCDSCDFGKKDESCEDVHPERVCRAYASQGTCEENKGYAYRFCASSCNTCDWARNPPCTDLHPDCADWADRGECVSNFQYMSTHCAKSCGTCNRYVYGGCANVDHDAFCEEQKTAGVCEKFKTQMKRDCRRSCGYCEAEPIPRFWECKDILPENCAYWKSIGECESNPTVLKAFCHQTCGHCKK